MADPTLTETLDSFYTATWAFRRAAAIDQIFKDNVYSVMMKKFGRWTTRVTSGRRYEIPIAKSSPNSAKFFGRGDTFAQGDIDPLGIAYCTWKNFGDSITRYWEDEQTNRGKEEIISLANTKFDIYVEAAKLLVEQTLLGSSNGRGTSVKMYNGLANFIQPDPTVSSFVMELDQSLYSWWRNQTKDMTGRAFATYGRDDLKSLMRTCRRWGKTPEYGLLSDQATFELYDQTVDDLKTLRDPRFADTTFSDEIVRFNGKPWAWSEEVSASDIYVICFPNILMEVDPIIDFQLTDWKQIPDGLDRVAQIVQRGQQTINKRRSHGILHSITG